MKINLYLILFIAWIIAVDEAHSSQNLAGVVREGRFIPPKNQPGKSGFISLVHQMQETNLCVPTSASIVLQYFGTHATPRELKILSRGHAYDPEKRFNDFTLTFFNDLISGVYSLVYNWKEKSYKNNKEGFRSGLADIFNSIYLGNTVIIDTTLYGGNSFVICGYDDINQSLVIVDPNISAPGIRVLNYRIVERIWNSRGVGFNGRGAIFTAPK